MERVPVSFLIPIKNEVANLPRCLAAIHWAAEVWVVDSGSSDGSVDIAKAYGAKVCQFDFNGVWPKKKTWALNTLPFTYDWVFILDADEVLPIDAEREIRSAVDQPEGEISGYWINRRFMFMGRWLRHSYYPNWNLRLFRKSLAHFERLAVGATNSGDNEVHEHVIVDGRTGYLQCEMDHHAFPSIDVFVEKHNRYSNWEAQVALEKQLLARSEIPHGAEAGLRRRLKRISQGLPFRPLLRFLYIYIVQRGFLDGVEGYYFARLHAFYELLCVAKTREARGRTLKAAVATRPNQDGEEVSIPRVR